MPAKNPACSSTTKFAPLTKPKTQPSRPNSSTEDLSLRALNHFSHGVAPAPPRNGRLSSAIAALGATASMNIATSRNHFSRIILILGLRNLTECVASCGDIILRKPIATASAWSYGCPFIRPISQAIPITRHKARPSTRKIGMTTTAAFAAMTNVNGTTQAKCRTINTGSAGVSQSSLPRNIWMAPTRGGFAFSYLPEILLKSPLVLVAFEARATALKLIVLLAQSGHATCTDECRFRG